MEGAPIHRAYLALVDDWEDPREEQDFGQNLNVFRESLPFVNPEQGSLANLGSISIRACLPSWIAVELLKVLFEE
jgi:hypothetical protein